MSSGGDRKNESAFKKKGLCRIMKVMRLMGFVSQLILF